MDHFNISFDLVWEYNKLNDWDANEKGDIKEAREMAQEHPKNFIK